MNYNTKEPELEKITCKKCNKKRRSFVNDICYDCFWNHTDTSPEKKTKRPEPDLSESKELIYFIQAGESGPIKIGTSYKLEERLKALQVGNSEELCVLTTIPTRHKVKLEQRLHTKFSDLRIRGE